MSREKERDTLDDGGEFGVTGEWWGSCCGTCGAADPKENEYCSDGFHAPGPTYWPGEESRASLPQEGNEE